MGPTHHTMDSLGTLVQTSGCAPLCTLKKGAACATCMHSHGLNIAFQYGRGQKMPTGAPMRKDMGYIVPGLGVKKDRIGPFVY